MKNTNRYTRYGSRRRFQLDKIIILFSLAVLITVGALLLPEYLQRQEDAKAVKTLPAETVDAEPPQIRIAAEEETAAEGGQLEIYIPTNSPSVNPLLSDTREMQYALSLVFENLINYDTSLRLIPALAESWEMMDNEGLTWKINLRKDVSWHGTGDTLTASDVIYTIGLLKSPDYQASPYAYHMELIAGYEAINENTLLITAVSPGISVLHALVFPVVSQQHFAPGTKPVGTGPYMADYGDKRFGLTFTANDKWWKQPPYIKRVIARCAQDNATALGSIELGKLNYVPSTAFSAAGYHEAGRTNLLEVMTQQSEMLLINGNSSRLKDTRVRKAIAYSLDRREIITRAYLNHAFACDVPVPPDSWLYDAKTKVYDYAPEKAAELLKAAGWEDIDGDGILDKSEDGSLYNLRLRLLVNDTPNNQTRKDAAQLIKTQLESAGIAVDIITSVWTEENNDYTQSLKNGAFDIAMAGFSLDAAGDLSPFLKTGGALNYGGYSDAQMDSLLETALKCSTEKDFGEAMANIQSLFIEQLPFIQLYFRTSFVICSADLKGIQNVRENLIFNGEEKWFFNSAGRERYADVSLGDASDWSSFDVLATPEQ